MLISVFLVGFGCYNNYIYVTMLLKLIFVYLSFIVVFCQANCFSGSTICHPAATCKNVSGIPTCVCGKWFVGDGIDYCYGVCNKLCETDGKGQCRSTSMGYTCRRQCENRDQRCSSERTVPGNLKVAWKSSTAVIFRWDFVRNAYLYSVALRALHSSSAIKSFSTQILVAGFDGLNPGTTYQFSIYIDSPQDNEFLNVTTDSRTKAVKDICDNPEGCQASTNECRLETHRCHVKATCSDTNRGYRCKCNQNYIGNGTLCVGICNRKDCIGSCRPDRFGRSCFCLKKTLKCKDPLTPQGEHLISQTKTTLVFGWKPVAGAASYVAEINSKTQPKKTFKSYQTFLLTAAFAGLSPGTPYTIRVSASNVAGKSRRKLTFSTSTVIASGPSVNITNIDSDEIAVSFSEVEYATSYEVEYYKEKNQVSRKTGKSTSYVLRNLTTGSFYHVIVYVNYPAGRSNGSAPVKVFVGPLCNKKKQRICSFNEHCSVDDECRCNDGYSRNDSTCIKTYAIPFRQNLHSGVTSNQQIQERLRQELDSKQISSFQVGNITKNSITFIIYTHNPNKTLKELNLGSLSHNHPMSIEEICVAKKISGYTFNETKAGNTQRSIETCSNGEPAAKIACMFNKTLSSRAVVLKSNFNESTLHLTDCQVATTQKTTTLPTYTDFTYQAKGAGNGSKTIYDIKVPGEAIKQAISQLNISDIEPNITVYQSSEEIKKKFPSNDSISFVVSIDIGENTTIENLQSPVIIVNYWENTTYGETKTLTSLKNTRVRQRCVYWDEEAKKWSGRGCCLDNYLFPPTCKCNHLSSFAILVSTVEVPADLVLNVFSDVACYLSIIGLAATFIILALNKEARKKVPNIIQLHFCFALFVTYVIFVFGVSRVQKFAVCTTITAVLHYFFLVSWIWIGIYSNRLYTALAQVFKQTGKNFIRNCCLFAYGLPLIVVAINLGVTVGYFDDQLKNNDLCDPDDPILKESFYKADNMCWLNSYSLYFGFLVIVGIILINNVIVLILVMAKLFQRQNIRSTRAKRSRFSDLISGLSLSFTLGLSWLFGFLMLVSTNVIYNRVMMWLFALLTASQGFAIWYVTCVRRKDIRDFWWHPIKKLFIRVGIKFGCISPITTQKLSAANGRSEWQTNSVTYLKTRQNYSSTK